DTGLREPKLRPAARRQVSSRACLRSWAGKLRQFRTERKDRKERMSKRRRQSAHAADRRVGRQKPGGGALADGGGLGGKAGPARRGWKRKGMLGKKLARRVPVAQWDSSRGFLIRRSQVRILPGTPLQTFCRSVKRRTAELRAISAATTAANSRERLHARHRAH